MAQLISGEILADSIKQNIRNTIAAGGYTPGLAIVLVGDDPASMLYVRLKKKAALLVGIEFHEYLLPTTSTEEEVMETIAWLNKDDSIDGIVVQLPLPQGFDEDAIIDAIHPMKDADGFHPENIKHLLQGTSTYEPALTKTVFSLLALPEESLTGKSALIIANAEVFAKPLTYLFEKQGIGARFISPSDPSIKEELGAADIVVVAVGKKDFIQDKDCKKGAIIIDIGINKDTDGTIVGDVEKEAYENDGNIAWVTPVPGGVGPVTIAMLLANVLELHLRKSQ